MAAQILSTRDIQKPPELVVIGVIIFSKNLGGENSKQMIEELLRNTITSGVDTDYWQKVQNRNRNTANSQSRLKPLDGFDDQKTVKKNNYLNKPDPSFQGKPRPFNTQNDFFDQNRGFQNPQNRKKNLLFYRTQRKSSIAWKYSSD